MAGVKCLSKIVSLLSILVLLASCGIGALLSGALARGRGVQLIRAAVLVFEAVEIFGTIGTEIVAVGDTVVVVVEIRSSVLILEAIEILG